MIVDVSKHIDSLKILPSVRNYHRYHSRIRSLPPVCLNWIGGVMDGVTSNTKVYGFEPRFGQTKDYKICICCFFFSLQVLIIC